MLTGEVVLASYCLGIVIVILLVRNGASRDEDPIFMGFAVLAWPLLVPIAVIYAFVWSIGFLALGSHAKKANLGG